MARPYKLLPILLLALFTFSVSGDVFVNINCGESQVKTDSNNFVWTPDNILIPNGVARVVQSSNSASDPIMDTLRVFTTLKKNCYSQQVTQGEKILVRASFNYGNYDGLSSPPTFDLHFDGNLWTTVETSLTDVTVHEVIYVAKGEVVSVCVAQTKLNQFPFMSALEIRSVDSEVYSDVDESRALILNFRSSYGASQPVRFPNDPYDRIWSPSGKDAGVPSEALLIDSTGPNNPPREILQNAVTADSTSDSLIFARVPPSSSLFYITMYFSEVTDLSSTTQTRSFRIYETSTTKNGPIQPPISPPYGAVVVRNLTNYSVESLTNISLVATVGSDLPPIINAAEAFSISDVLTDGTDSNDVEALALLQTTFNVLGEWTGDPCLPASYWWDWLNCSDDARPRVTSLYLDSFELTGSFPDISSMDALEIIDLHNNSLTGTIPGFLGTMSNLQQLNLANNKFSGSIPTTLSKNNKLKLNVTGNPSLCTSGKSCSTSSSPGSTGVTNSKKSSSLPLVLGITIPAFFLVWVVVGIFIILRRKRNAINVNMPNVAGGKENGQTGGGANANSNGLHKIGENMENVAPQTFGSPSPLLDDSGNTSDLYGNTEEHNP